MSGRRLVVAALLVDDPSRPTRVLAARRSTPPSLAGRWEFPGGKVEDGESPTDALRRELREELQVEITVLEELPPAAGAAWAISESLELRTWWAVIASGTAVPTGSHDRVAWLAPAGLLEMSWLEADRPVAAAVHRRMSPAL